MSGSTGLLPVASLLLLLAAACAAEPDNQGSAPADDGRTVGTVYADLHLDFVDPQGNTGKRTYLAKTALCDEAGLGGSRLAGSDLERLGTARVQVWSAPDRVAYRHERFTAPGGSFETGDRCNFELLSTGYHRYVDAAEDTTLTLDSGESITSPTPEAHLWQRTPVAQVSADTTTARSAGGAACAERSIFGSGGSYCIWTGGGAYGFGVEGGALSAVTSASHLLSALVIEQTPAPSGHGIRANLRALVLDDTSVLDDMRPTPATARPARGSAGGLP